MTVLETPLGEIELRSDQVQLASTLDRTPRITPAGVPVVVGDGGWSPETLIITLRVADPDRADGVLETQDLIARLRSATRLRALFRAAPVVALRRVKRENRGVHWVLAAEFVIGPWIDLLLPNVVTVLGQTVTISGAPLTVEVT